jgi:SEC-C motif-containing protein
MTCPCGSNLTYETCCGKFHSGEQTAPTARALMRSRYSAFAKHEIDYLKQTTWPPYQKHFDEAGYFSRAKDSIWLRLQILHSEDGKESDTKGTVTFIAKSMLNGELVEQREKSFFKKKNGVWYYLKAME